MRTAILRRCCAVVLTCFAACAAADERQELEALRATTLNLIRLLVEQGVLTQEKANTLIKQAEEAAARPGEKPKPAVVVPYVPETVRQQMKDELREEVMATARAERWAEPGALPDWARRLTFEGDVRLRLQNDMLDENNAPAAFFQSLGQNINNTTEDRARLRLRARFGVRARVLEELEAGFALATGTVGSTGSPNSTNNTLGDYLNRQAAGIDLAYLDWQPREWLRFVGGRFRNPFLTTELLWANDLNFDGVALTGRPFFREDVRPYLTLGAFPLREFEPTPDNTTRKNKWLYGTQLGIDLGYAEDTQVRLAAAYYDYRHVEGVPNTDPANPNLYDWTAPQFRQKGNTLFPINLAGSPTLFALASQFQLLAFSAELGLRYDELRRFTVAADWVRNVGYDQAEIFNRTGGLDLPPRTGARGVRLAFGHRQMERFGDWFAFGGYRRIEADSVLDAFNDGDFYLGGTNAKGWLLGGGYSIGRNAWFAAKYTTANQIDGPPLAIDVLQLDFNARF